MKTLQEKMQDYKARNATICDFSRMGLDALPAEVLELSYVQRLNLSDNNLKELPDEFSQFASLEHLDLRANKLRAYPQALLKMPAIKAIYLGGNNLLVDEEWMYSLLPIPYETASQAVLEIANRGFRSNDPIIIHSSQEKPYGWVFHYVKQRFLETGSFNDIIIGGGPIIYNAYLREISHCATSLTLNESLARYEEERIGRVVSDVTYVYELFLDEWDETPKWKRPQVVQLVAEVLDINAEDAEKKLDDYCLMTGSEQEMKEWKRLFFAKGLNMEIEFAWIE